MLIQWKELNGTNSEFALKNLQIGSLPYPRFLYLACLLVSSSGIACKKVSWYYSKSKVWLSDGRGRRKIIHMQTITSNIAGK